MRTLLAGLILMLGLATPGSALPPAAERLQNRLNSVHSLRAEFTQTREVSITGEVIEAPGFLVCRQPHDFHLTYTDEDRQEVIVTGDSLWVIMPLEGQAILYPFDPSAPGSEAFFLFGGQGRPLDEVFSFVQEPWAGYADALLLEPRVKDPGYPFEEMRLVVDSQGFPALFFYAEVTGDLVTMRFTRVEGDPENLEAALAFELPDSIEVFDTRELDSDLR